MNFTSKVTFSFPLSNSRHRPFSWFYCDFLSPLCPLSLTCRWSSCCTQHRTDPRTFWNGRLRESETMGMFHGVSNRFRGARMSLFSVCSRSATDWTLIKCPSLNWELGLARVLQFWHWCTIYTEGFHPAESTNNPTPLTIEESKNLRHCCLNITWYLHGSRLSKKIS